MSRIRLVPRLGHRTAEPRRSCRTTASTVRWSVHAKLERTELHSRAEAKHRTVELRHRSMRPSIPKFPHRAGVRARWGCSPTGPASLRRPTRQLHNFLRRLPQVVRHLKLQSGLRQQLPALRRIRKPAATVSLVAPPPTSRKLAGSLPASLMTSIVAMARPAPFTIQPIFPSSFT
jgi:hypothetical protein